MLVLLNLAPRKILYSFDASTQPELRDNVGYVVMRMSQSKPWCFVFFDVLCLTPAFLCFCIFLTFSFFRVDWPVLRQLERPQGTDNK